MERAVALVALTRSRRDLPAKVRSTSAKIVITTESPGSSSRSTMERRYVRQVLNAVGGNKNHAARIPASIVARSTAARGSRVTSRRPSPHIRGTVDESADERSQPTPTGFYGASHGHPGEAEHT